MYETGIVIIHDVVTVKFNILMVLINKFSGADCCIVVTLNPFLGFRPASAQ